MRFPLSLLLSFAFASGSPGQSIREVSLSTLLPEMNDLARLAKRPKPSYTAAQASSYDRNAKEPGSEAWFANGDAGKFLREETVGTRREYVMADLKGPGAVVRVWSANPVGVVRFYFDGEADARFTWHLADLIGGKIRPFTDPLAYFSARGANLYFPFPYAKSLKVTIDNSQGDGVRGLYYHIGYRSYAPTTFVKSVSPTELAHAEKEIAEAASELSRNFAETGIPAAQSVQGRLDPMWFEEVLLERKGPEAITSFKLRFKLHEGDASVRDLPWDHPKQLHNALRKVRLVADFDGERSIDVPIPDFFSSAAGGVPFASQPIVVSEDGWMHCRFVMPYGKSAKVSLVSLGGPRLDVEFQFGFDSFRFDDETYLFRAQWLGNRLRTRPMVDMEFLRTRGEGVFVGTSLHVANPTGTWWGEGDEKVFVDGEAFPSTFGTGTEDYFGYAWCDPTPFTRPFHAQPRCDGPGNRGHTNVVRYQTFDPIPFRGQIRFDIELWHWADVEVDFDRVSYWYSLPRSAGPRPVEDWRQLLLTHIPLPEPVKGAIEGETAAIVSKSGGETEIQAFGELSMGKQLWWRDAKQGDRLVLRMNVPADGDYEVTGYFCHAKDYGVHKLTFAGQVLREAIDFYSANLEWKIVRLGTYRFKGGTAELVVESLGHRPEAEPRNMFGLDYLLFKKIE